MTEPLPHGRLNPGGSLPPREVEQRINSHPGSGVEKVLAKLLAGHLEGLRPGELTGPEREHLFQYGEDNALAGLKLLCDVGYGPELYTRDRKPLTQRAHGLDRERRLDGVIGKLPRALALRLPTSADTHRTGPARGRDRWGQVNCSSTLRPSHLGLIAALGGLWAKRTSADQPYVGCTAGELAQLLYGRTRLGGRDIVSIHTLLSDLEQLEITATGDEDLDSQYRIPCSPIVLVERRVGNDWICASDYDQALADDTGAEGQIQVAVDEATGGPETIRVHLAAWVRKELSHSKRRPVFLDLDVWAHLRPQAARLYAFLQASSRDSYDKSIYFYLAGPTRFTLGLRGRLDRCGHSVSTDLAAIVKADRRYERFRRQHHANTTIPAFGVEARNRPSEATELAKLTKCEPKRSRLARHLDSLRRQALRTSQDGTVTLRDFRKIAATIDRTPKAPTRPRRPAVRRQLYPPADAAAPAAT